MKISCFLASFFFCLQVASAQVSVSISELTEQKISMNIKNEGDDVVFVPGYVETGPPTILPNIEVSDDNTNWEQVIIASCGLGIRWFPLLPESSRTVTFDELAELKPGPKHLRVILNYTYYDPNGEEFPNILVQKTIVEK